MNRRFYITALALAFAAPLPAMAHHSFAMFDPTKELELKGTVVQWEWSSPHTWLYLLVPNGNAEPDKYSIEGANPGVLRRTGFGKGTMQPGDNVTVYVSPLRSGEKGGAMNAVVLPDGKMLGTRMEQQPPAQQ